MVHPRMIVTDQCMSTHIPGVQGIRAKGTDSVLQEKLCMRNTVAATVLLFCFLPSLQLAAIIAGLVMESTVMTLLLLALTLSSLGCTCLPQSKKRPSA